MSRKRKILMFSLIAAALFILFLGASFALQITIANAVLADVIVAIDDEEPEEEEKEGDKESATVEEGSTEYIIGVNCFDELHQLILQTDINRLTGNENGINPKGGVQPLKTGGGTPLNIKSYLNLYALAAEICLREEINPKGSDVIIEPMDLIGESFAECGLMNYNAELANSVCIFESKEKLTTGDLAVSAAALELQPGSDWGSAWGPDTECKAKKYSLANCHGFFGQAVFYSYLWDDKWGNAGICIYISTAENPNLDTSKRAIHGSRQSIYGGNGKYVDGNFWLDYNKQTNAPSSEIKASLKYGIFEKGQEFGYTTRPCSYFLPDCMYTHALHLRSFLRDRKSGTSNIHETDSTGRWSVSNFDILCPNLDAEQKKYLAVVKKMYALTRFTGDSTYPDDVTSSTPGSPGELTRVYAEMVTTKQNPLVFQEKSNDNDRLRSTCLGACNNICAVFIHGVANTMTEGSALYEQFIKYKDHKLTLSNELRQIIPGCGGNHTTYGFDSINAGDLAKPAFEAQIKYAYSVAKKVNLSSLRPTEIAQMSANLCWPLKASSNTILKNGYFGQRAADFHPGIDIKAEPGENVYAIASGTVVEVAPTGLRNNSKYVIIEHGTDSSMTLFSMYFNTTPQVSAGDKIKQRQQIGAVASYSAEFGVTDSNTAVPVSTGRSYLHLTVSVYKKGASIPYPDVYNQDWSMHEYALKMGSFNPSCVDWYMDTTETASKVVIKSHEDTDLAEVYKSLASNSDVVNYNNIGADTAPWIFSLNNTSSDAGSSLSEAIQAEEWTEIYALPSNMSGYYGQGYAGKDNIPGYSALTKTILKDAVNTSLAVASIMGIDGSTHGLPIPEEFFTASHITQAYGDPVENDVVSNKGNHAGIDFGGFGDVEVPVYAVSDGIVEEVHTTAMDGIYQATGSVGPGGHAFGNYVWVKMDNGCIITYNHLKLGSNTQWRWGDVVKKGDQIGIVGNSGVSIGTHLHLEFKVNDNIFSALSYTTIPSGGHIRYYNARKTVDPWLLYFMDPKYDFLRMNAPGTYRGVGPYTVFTYLGVKLDPINNPNFREELLHR